MTRALAVVLALALSACSFLSIERLPSGYRATDTPRCSESPAAKYADLIGGAWFSVLTMVGVYSIATARSRDREPPYGATAGFAAIAFTFTSSYLWARHQDRRCDRARDAHDRFVESLD